MSVSYLILRCQVLYPLNFDNLHWVVLRTSKIQNLVELFIWLGSDWERERAHIEAQPIVAYLVAVGHLTASPTVVCRFSPEWQQCDGSSCGLFTCGCIISLAQGQRVSLVQMRPRSWRRYFANAIVMRCAPFLGGTP